MREVQRTGGGDAVGRSGGRFVAGGPVGTSRSGAPRFIRYSPWLTIGPMPASAAFSRNAAISSGLWLMGFQVRGLWVNTWMVSHPMA